MAGTGRVLLSLLHRRERIVYGPHASQRAELRVPRGGGGAHPVVVVIHGGSWQARYSKVVTSFVSADLARRGFASVNVEYRRVGRDGGYPQTLDDVRAAIECVLERDDGRLNLDDVTVLGHSAGGQLALWAASQLPVRRVVAMAAPCDLVRGFGPSVRAFLGGTPEEVPERYAACSPLALAPIGVPTLLAHGVNDATVSVKHSRRYAQVAGAEATLVELEDAVHRAWVDPRTPAWNTVAEWL